MAESQVEVEGGSETRLKHLGFVRILTVNTVVLVSNLYGYAKQNSGSFRSSVDTVESSVKAVVEPVYDRFSGVPSNFLIFLDEKVDVLINKFDEVAPPLAKKLVHETQTAVGKAAQVAKQLTEEARAESPFLALNHAVEIVKQLSITQLAVVWYKVNTHPTLGGISRSALPTAAYWSEKYNNLVTELNAKGYAFFRYVPLVPVEDIAKAYKQVEAGEAKKTDAPTTDSGEE
ncbi:hypothetical protein M569_15700 [Genlisea aurea]|uniref:REF/SRPP-like protein n=1 Tax=Genlisea aurea TaxID=192259 RepID=S8BWW9_9LAMI|nr:hypothetical protein M569_15700 [Genlisea aurea]